MVEVSLTVGKLDASLALLLTKEHHLIEFPTVLLPADVVAGSIVKISCERNVQQEEVDQQVFNKVQDDILTLYGKISPKPPVLRARNVTQTSVALEWDPIDVATSEILSLTLYKNNERFGSIPNPLRRTLTKVSGLAINESYNFKLVLKTTAGVYESKNLHVHTHKMTDLTGVTVCIGALDSSEYDEEFISKVVGKIGGKPIQHSVKLDTTHFVCTEPTGTQWQRARDLNIPIVRPEWLLQCESERRLVGVRAYYLTADPKKRPAIVRRKSESSDNTAATTVAASTAANSAPGSAPVETIDEASPSLSKAPSPALEANEPEVDGNSSQKDTEPAQDTEISQTQAELPSAEPTADAQSFVEGNTEHPPKSLTDTPSDVPLTEQPDNEVTNDKEEIDETREPDVVGDESSEKAATTDNVPADQDVTSNEDAVPNTESSDDPKAAVEQDNIQADEESGDLADSLQDVKL